MAAAGRTQTRAAPPPHSTTQRPHPQYALHAANPFFSLKYSPANHAVKEDGKATMAPTIMQSDDNYSAPDYCGGSALFRSMKYAETWLNLTVSDRVAQRPKLLINDRPPFLVTTNMCSCPDFGRNTKSKKPVCSKCRGCRLYPETNSKNKRNVDQFYSVRIPRQVSNKNSILRNDVDFFEDPYSVMWRSRLQSPPNSKTPEKTRKCRAKSSSPPGRRKRKSHSPVLKPTRCPSPDEISKKFDDYMVQKERENSLLTGAGGRKSILDCSVNAYELIRLKNKTGSNAKEPPFSVTDEEFFKDLNCPVNNSSCRNKPSSKFNSLTSTLNKKKLLSSLLSRKQTSDDSKKLSSPRGVKIAGQRMKIFDESSPRIEPNVDRINEFVYESDQTSDSYEPVSFNSYQTSEDKDSPQRPPRKTKICDSGPDEATHYQVLSSPNPPEPDVPIVPKNRVNFDLKQEHGFNKNSTLTSSTSLEIKSILKKPPNFNNLFNFNNILVEDAVSESIYDKPTYRKEPRSKNTVDISDINPVSKINFSQPLTVISADSNRNNVSFHNIQSESKQMASVSKKKKQVQFKVNKVEVIPANLVRNEEDSPLRNSKIEVPDQVELLSDQTRQEIQEPPGSTDLAGACQTVEESDQPKTVDCSVPVDESAASKVPSEDPLVTTPPSKRLHRSFSERITVPPLTNDSQAFNDTMRLNLRMGRRGDSRIMFSIDEDEPTFGNERVISPSRSRPKEPPPPPPPPSQKQRALSPPKPPPRLIFPFAKHVSRIDTGTEAPPTPPPPTETATSQNNTSPQQSSAAQLIYIENNYIDFVSKVSPDAPEIKGESKIKLEIKCDGENSSASKNQSEDDKSDAEETEKRRREACNTVSIVPIDSSPRKVSTVIISSSDGDAYNCDPNSSVTVIGPSPIRTANSNNKITINVGDFKNQRDESFYQNSIQINDSAVTPQQIPTPIAEDCDEENQKNPPPAEKSRLEEIVEETTDSEPIADVDANQVTENEESLESIAKQSDDSYDSNVRTETAKNLMNNLIRRNYDPILAVRQNLIPHICGKKMELERFSEESSWDSSNNSSVSSAPSKRSVPEDKPEIFYSSKNIIDKLPGENPDHYESVSDPIYEEISDIPPPLPLSPPPPLTTLENIIDDTIPTRSIFEGASKYDILNYLVDAKQRCIVTEEPEYVIEESIINQTIMEEEGDVQTPAHSRINSLDLSCRHSQASDSSEDSCNLISSSNNSSIRHSNKVRKSCAEIERNDSGVGSETSQCSRSKWQHLSMDNFREDQQHICEDCDQPVETQVSDSGLMFAPLVCRKCSKRRAERREIIAEIVETEEKYGRDLRIILDEFYRPMLVAGLLTPEQLTFIFLNVEELLENNTVLAEKLRDTLEIAVEQGDEDLLTVNIGRIFLETTSMLHAFESYCTKQGAAAMMLANLEKEKELLRIFLRVSQMENSVLRRMNLNSFLMVPVQRVTKYPLLLARLYKVTPLHHTGRELLKEAQHKIELHLEHMNSLAKDIGSTKLWRRISIINGRRSNSETDMITIKLRKIAVDVLDWTHEDVRFAIEGRLLFTQPTDHNWRKGRTIKLSPINAMVVTSGKPTENYHPDSDEILTFPRNHGIKEATLLLLKEKSGRFALLREPLFLDRCIVCSDSDWEEYFEVQELVTKDTYIFKAEDNEKTKLWYKQLQYHAQGLGQWRKRRNALANIMINGMQLRS